LLLALPALHGALRERDILIIEDMVTPQVLGVEQQHIVVAGILIGSN